MAEPETRIIDTTVGRVLFNRILPEEVQFVNEVLEKGGVKDLIAEVYEICGQEITTNVADAVKHIGFTYAMRSGITLAVSDIAVPPAKQEIIAGALKEVEVVQRDFRRGLLTDQDKTNASSRSGRRPPLTWRRPCEPIWIQAATWRRWPALARPRAVLDLFRSWPACAV